jgi:phage terminase large subunit-like protein
MVIYDELHAAPDRRLYDVLSTSMGARTQPLMLVISTAGFDRHSILWELYTHAKKVQENPSIDPTFLPILYEAPEGADWTSQRVWKKANPALGDFRSLEEMQIVAARARAIPAQENTFKRLYLNMWTEQASRWLALEAWDGCLVDDARRVPA